jgi:hypothetical protein
MNHSNEIVKMCEEASKTTVNNEKPYELSMVKHFIELIGEENFNCKFENYFIYKDEDFDSCFYDFHKSMRQTDFYEIGEGHLDMLFWNFIQISDTTYEVLKKYYNKYKMLEQYLQNIGKKVMKCSIGEQEKNHKPFKSGFQTNTIKDVVMHEFIDEPAYVFNEDDSYVECRRCKIINE